MDLLIKTDTKKMILKEKNQKTIYFDYNNADFDFDHFLNKWLDLLYYIKNDKLLEHNYKIYLKYIAATKSGSVLSKIYYKFYLDLNKGFNLSRIREYDKVSNKNLKIHLWHIAAPKSGSTWLTQILQNLLQWNVCPLMLIHDRREHEISIVNLIHAVMQDYCFSPHQHCRYSEATLKIINKLEIKPILQYRNIYDTVVSFYDHCEKMLNFPMAYMDENNWKSLNENERMDFVIDLIVPWYFNFYAGWFSSDLVKEGKILLISYESLLSNPYNEVKKIIDWIGIQKSDEEINSAIFSTKDQFTMKNVGIVGRGTVLTIEQKQRIKKMASYYPKIDFSSLGI